MATETPKHKKQPKLSDEEVFSPESEDTLGPYPAKVNVPALEGRRYIWTARAFAIAFYLSVILNVVLASVIFNLVPLKRVEPMLVTFKDKSDQIVRIEPFTRGMPGFVIMSEKLTRDYVKAREEILASDIEMQDRWGRAVKYQTTPQAYQQFIGEKQPLLNQARRSGLTRTIKIESVNKLARNTLLVTFQATDYGRTGAVLETSSWQATLQYTYAPDAVRYEDRFINPLGFKVVRYSLARKG